MFNNARSKVKHDMPLKDLKRGGFVIKEKVFITSVHLFPLLTLWGQGSMLTKM